MASPDRPPTPGDVALGLRPIRALVLVDDVDLDTDDVQRLLDAAPGSVFVLASTQRLLFGEGRALGLPGLPETDALRLFASEPGRVLAVGEHTAAARVCAAIRLAFCRQRRGSGTGISLFDLAGEIEGRSRPTELTARRLSGLSEAERRVLGLLAATGDADLGVEHIERLVGQGAPDALASLEQRHLIESHSPRYSLRATLDPDLDGDLAPSEWSAQVARYLVEWGRMRSMGVWAMWTVPGRRGRTYGYWRRRAHRGGPSPNPFD